MINELNILENILLHFNVEPTEPLPQYKKTYLAVSSEIPNIGQPFNCSVLQINKGELTINKFSTTTVINILAKAENLLVVQTLKAFYIILLPCQSPTNVFFARDLVPPIAGRYSCINEIVFSKYNEKYIFQVVRRRNVFIEQVVKISLDIYYIQTRFSNYFILI